MGAHVFLVGEENFEICIQRGVYGCVMPTKEWNQAEIVAGIFGIQSGDLVFFYVKNKGVFGLWKVVETPFFDQTKIWPNDEQDFPYRFCFEPAVGYFSKPVALTDILDLHDKGRIWTFDLNPVQQKNQYKITTDEARELLRLLLRNNPIKRELRKILEPYSPPPGRTPIDVDFTSSTANKIKYEGWLNAWFMRSLATGKLKGLLGEYQEYLNLVPTTFNKVMDIFLTHVTTIDGIDVLHKYTCLELKTDLATDSDLTQILRYEDWLARKLASGDHEMIQSVLVANRFSDQVIDYVSTRQRIEEKVIRLISYELVPARQDIELHEITF